jgi:hypothetical protein
MLGADGPNSLQHSGKARQRVRNVAPSDMSSEMSWDIRLEDRSFRMLRYIGPMVIAAQTDGRACLNIPQRGGLAYLPAFEGADSQSGIPAS